jgi:hypothetical protein
VKLNGFIQHWTTVSDNDWDMQVIHARFRVTALVDENTTLALMPEYAPTGLTLLDAYATRSLGNGWSILAGQFKPAFGDDRYLTPIQFKRTNYIRLNGFAFMGSARPWDMGFEIKRVGEHLTFQAGLVQGAGPNVAADTDLVKDLFGRAEWKGEHFALGASYYGGTNNTGAAAGYTPLTEFSNWFGAHARFQKDGFDLRAEGILAPMDRAGLFGQAAYKAGDWEPLAWYETGGVGSVVSYQVLGAGLNHWPAAKTKVSLNATVTGATDFSADSMAVLQVEQVF